MRVAAPRLLAVLLVAALGSGGCAGAPPGTSRWLNPPVPAGPGNVDGTSQPVRDPLYPAYGNPALDVLHYGLRLAWDPASRTLTGQATLRMRVLQDQHALQLDLTGPYTLRGSTVDGVAVPGRVGDGKLTVERAVAAGATVTLVVDYAGTPVPVPMPSHRGDAEPLGLTVTADGGLWTMQEPYGASTWYPANDQPSDKALYDIVVSVPAGWQAVLSGTPVPAEANTFASTSAVPVASYLTTLAVGRYDRLQLSGPHELPVTVWTRTGLDADLLPVLRRAPQQLHWLESKFGRYPFASAGVVVVPSSSGMETQQMVTIGAGVSPRNAEGLDSVMLHEYAHQWFGDAVTPATWQDVWLNEGWATYAEALYVAERDRRPLADWARQGRTTDGDLRARLGPPGSPRPDSFAEGNVYLCPALMLYELHQALGDAAFFRLAREWVAEQAGTSQTRAGFVAFVNRQTGRDFTALITAWLDSPATPA